MSERKNLFGENIEANENNDQQKFKKWLSENDNNTLDDRASRLKLIHYLRDNNEFLFSIDFEGHYLYKECEQCFVNGLYAATIILAHGIIDRFLQGLLSKKGYAEKSGIGSKKKLDFIKEKELLHLFLVDEIDKLRRKRNRFIHLVEYDDGMQIEDRLIASQVNNPMQLIAKDAEFAVRLLYEFYRAQG